MPTITIVIGENYLKDLDRRLKQFGISRYRLARETDITETQLSRWFSRGTKPRIHNIERIETGIIAIRRKDERAAKRKKKK